MCPPGPSPSSDIGACWTDEELIMLLQRIQRGSSLPGNVLADVNPFEYRPSNLPDDVWYFVHFENQKNIEIGYWKARGEACEIYSDSEVTGWRTTLQFDEGQSQNGHGTGWMMQKYWITQKQLNNLKASGSLYRVFPCDGSGKHKRQRYLISDGLIGEENTLLEEERNCYSQSGPTKKALVDGSHEETKSTHPDGDQDNIDCFARGDYLELLDLVNPQSSSSSSDNSSCVSMASDEVFDYLALLNDLEPESSKDQPKSTSCNLSVSMSSIPKEVVLPPAISGTLDTREGSRSPTNPLNAEHPRPSVGFEDALENKNATKHAKQTQMIQDGRQTFLNSHASTSESLVPDKVKKVALGKMKMLKKKYLCFMPF